MSADMPASQPEVWEPIPPLERRVLGVLIEKQKTSRSSEGYPLTLNSLTTGCNQKSNRDPVLDLTEDDVEEPLTSLQKKGFVTRVTGSRVEKFRHELYEAWTRNGAQMAVLAELLLRGPQTKAELRARAARMDAIDTLDQLDEVLKPLVERKLVVWLTDPDRRGAQLTHGFHQPGELSNLRTQQAALPTSSPISANPPSAATSPAASSRLDQAFSEIASLKQQIAALEAAFAELNQRMQSEG